MKDFIDSLGPDNKMLTATIVGIMIQMLINQGLTDTAIANMFSRRKVREVIRVLREKKQKELAKEPQ